MKLPNVIRRALLKRARHIIATREPDRVIGIGYMRRWHLVPRNRWLNVYLHEFSGSDDDRALHDHPWRSASIILYGHYYEHLPIGRGNPAHMATWPKLRVAGQITARRADAAHRIEIPDAHATAFDPVITLFITGPRRREWGFWCKHGWRHWRVFTDPKDTGRIGRGCD